MKKYEELKKYLLSNEGELTSVISEINSIDSSFEYLEYYENDEYFFETFFPNNSMEAVRTTYYGDYNFNDDYVRFDAYGNVESFNDWKLMKEYEDNIDDIIEKLIEHYEDIYLSEELSELIEKYVKED